MRGKVWLKYFFEIFYELHKNRDYTAKQWTEFLQKVMDGIGTKMSCRVAQKRPKRYGGEYLNIDAIYFDEYEYEFIDKDNDYDPFVLPRVVVELENSPDIKYIAYCLWKILCVRSLIMVLICYQGTDEKCWKLKEYLEEVIWQNSLMKGNEGDLIVMIGNDGFNGEKFSLNKYYIIFEWRGDKLERIIT